jgi:ClpP class serine protease
MKRRGKLAPQSYQRGGVLAVHPLAFVELFVVPESRENEALGNVVIVDICGPLSQHDDGFFDSYEAIRARVQAACESAATAIVLRIDSPGGDAAGCFDSARAIRAMCTAAGKPLWAHVDGKACSAAYALAAAAAKIYLGDTGIVGSIGIVSVREDQSAMNAARGLRVELISSGARKGDGNPSVALTDGELKATQQIIDSMAAVFFELVAEFRGTDAAQVEALQAGLFHGDLAIRAHLADGLQSFDEMLASIASGRIGMSSSYEKAKAALEEAAEGDDANAAAAKRALAAMEEPDAGEPEPEGDQPPPAKKDEAAAGDAPEPDDEEKKKAAAAAASKAAAPAKAAASTHDIALEALAEVHKLKAEGAQVKLTAERAALLASRPDFSPDFLAVLKTADIATVRKFVKSLPKVPVAKPAATAVVAGTRGEGQGGPAAAPSMTAVTEMDRAMGLTATTLAARRVGNSLQFGVTEVPMVPTAHGATAAGDK